MRHRLNWGFLVAALVFLGITVGMVLGGLHMINVKPSYGSVKCNGQVMGSDDRCIHTVNGASQGSRTAQQQAEDDTNPERFGGWVVLVLAALPGLFTVTTTAQILD